MPDFRRAKLKDPDVEFAVRQLQQAIEASERGLFAGAKLMTSAPEFPDVDGDRFTLTNNVINKIRHGLGRAYRFCLVSYVPVTTGTAGSVEEVRVDGAITVDPKVEVWLKPVGFGASNINVRLVLL